MICRKRVLLYFMDCGKRRRWQWRWRWRRRQYSHNAQVCTYNNEKTQQDKTWRGETPNVNRWSLTSQLTADDGALALRLYLVLCLLIYSTVLHIHISHTDIVKQQVTMYYYHYFGGVVILGWMNCVLTQNILGKSQYLKLLHTHIINYYASAAHPIPS